MAGSTRISDFLAIWAPIVLGKHRTPDGYRRALRDARCDLTDWGNELLGHVSCSQEESTVLLVRIPVGYLGYQAGSAYRGICERGRSLGLELCPPEAGPAIRLQYPDRHHPEGLYVAMEPLPCGKGMRGIFRLEKGRCFGPALNGSRGEPDVYYRADSYFIFMQP